MTKGDANRCFNQICDDMTNGQIAQLEGAYFLGLPTDCSVQDSYMGKKKIFVFINFVDIKKFIQQSSKNSNFF